MNTRTLGLELGFIKNSAGLLKKLIDIRKGVVPRTRAMQELAMKWKDTGNTGQKAVATAVHGFNDIPRALGEGTVWKGGKVPAGGYNYGDVKDQQALTRKFVDLWTSNPAKELPGGDLKWLKQLQNAKEVEMGRQPSDSFIMPFYRKYIEGRPQMTSVPKKLPTDKLWRAYTGQLPPKADEARTILKTRHPEFLQELQDAMRDMARASK